MIPLLHMPAHPPRLKLGLEFCNSAGQALTAAKYSPSNLGILETLQLPIIAALEKLLPDTVVTSECLETKVVVTFFRCTFVH